RSTASGSSCRRRSRTSWSLRARCGLSERKNGSSDAVLQLMGSHVLTPPLTLHAPSRATVRIVLAIVAVAALAALSLAFARARPRARPAAPAQCEGDTLAR